MNELKKIMSIPLWVFLGVTLLGFFSLMVLGEDCWLSKIYAALDVASAVALAVLAFMVYFKYGKQLQPIVIRIEKEGEAIDLPFHILRKDFTRSELFGVLRAFNKGKDFEIACTLTSGFYKEIENIQNAKSDVFVIKIDASDKCDFGI